MKLTKNHLKQLIQEMMEAEEMEAEEMESDGKIRIQARLRTDDAFKAAQEETEARGAGQNTFQMAEYVITLPDGEEIIIPDNDTLEDLESDPVIAKAFAIAQGYQGGTEEDKIKGFGGASQPGGFDEDGNLLDRDLGDFQAYIDGFKIPKAEPASEELIKAFKKFRGKKPRYKSFKARPVSRRRADDEYHDSRRPGRTPFRRFEEGKLTQSRLKQMIREAMFGEQDVPGPTSVVQTQTDDRKGTPRGQSMAPESDLADYSAIVEKMRKLRMQLATASNTDEALPILYEIEKLINAVPRANRQTRYVVGDGQQLSAREIFSSSLDMVRDIPSSKAAPRKRNRAIAKTRRRSKKPYFFRRYRNKNMPGQSKSAMALFLNMFKRKGDKSNVEAFDRFYADTGFRGRRDYQFGPSHYRAFERLFRSRQRGQGTVTGAMGESKYYHKGLEAGIFDKQYLMDIISDEIERYLAEKNADELSPEEKENMRDAIMDATSELLQGDEGMEVTSPLSKRSDMPMIPVSSLKLEEVIRQELKKKVLEQTNVPVNRALVRRMQQARKAKKAPRKKSLIDQIYDATGGKAESDFPKYAVGPADRVSQMANPYDYTRKTEEEKDKYDASMAIASLLSLGTAAGVATAGKIPATTGAKLKAYLASKGLDAPAIATSTYADYKQIELKKRRKPKSQSQFNAAKNLILNLFPTKTAGGGAAAVIGTQLE